MVFYASLRASKTFMHLWASAEVAIGTNCRVCSLKLIQVVFIERKVETLTILHRWKARDV